MQIVFTAVLQSVFAVCLAGISEYAAAAEPLPSGYVYLRGIDPTIIQDIRYASAANFTQAPVPGYRAGECILLREAAEALKLVQADLRPRGLSLKVYDCYRPARAVKYFMQWVHQPEVAGGGRYRPRTDRNELIKLGYIAAKSIHSKGAAIDLTLVALPPARAPKFDPKAAYGPCNGPKSDREPDNGLDMGTSFDCFDPMSYTDSEEISADQRENRRMLIDAMTPRGFNNYIREWWHFTYLGFSPSAKAQDFVISARAFEIQNTTEAKRLADEANQRERQRQVAELAADQDREQAARAAANTAEAQKGATEEATELAAAQAREQAAQAADTAEGRKRTADEAAKAALLAAYAQRELAKTAGKLADQQSQRAKIAFGFGIIAASAAIFFVIIWKRRKRLIRIAKSARAPPRLGLPAKSNRLSANRTASARRRDPPSPYRPNQLLQ